VVLLSKFQAFYIAILAPLWFDLGMHQSQNSWFYGIGFGTDGIDFSFGFGFEILQKN
jgi:hypothetical protein